MLGFVDGQEEDSVAYGLIGVQRRRDHWRTALKAFAALGALAAIIMLASDGGTRSYNAL